MYPFYNPLGLVGTWGYLAVARRTLPGEHANVGYLEVELAHGAAVLAAATTLTLVQE